MEFDKDFLGKLFEQAVANPRLRQNSTCVHHRQTAASVC